MYGLHVGFTQESPLAPVGCNMHSAVLHLSLFDAYLGTKLQEGKMLGPFPWDRATGLHISRMGVVPKGHTPGKWKLIIDLSYLKGTSKNDAIKE